MAKTKISWTEYSWNPVSGCTEVSPGCDNCYARVQAERYRGGKAFPNGFDITLRPHKLREPEKWHPSRIFVNSMSDLFHRDIPDEFLYQIWQTMLDVDKHIYQVLTKRPHRMAHKIETLGLETASHIYLGTSTENQEFFDNRIPVLLSIGGKSPKWVSCEPLLGPIDLSPYLKGSYNPINGGESTQGGSGLPVCSCKDNSNRQSRERMERTPQSRERHGQISTGSDNAERSSPSRIGSSSSMATLLGSNSRQSSDQSYQRRWEGQSPGEFGADNRVDEYSTRCKDIRQGEDRESTRRGEPRKQTIQITGERNTTPTISGRETCNDCGGLRGEISNDLKNRSQRTLDWCVVGGESGAGRRLMDYDWARLIRDQCVASDTAFYYKQGNNFKPGMDNFLNGRTWEQHPGDVEVVNITSAPRLIE